MDERQYWELIERVWEDVDGRVLVDALARGEPPIGLEDRYRKFLAGLVTRLDALAIDDARSMIECHRACIRVLDSDSILSAVGRWMYDSADDGLALIPLLGEAFHRRVVSSADAAAVLSRSPGLKAAGGWRVLTEPVRKRWRAALLSEIPACFADVAYPGDSDVTSGDWPTPEGCRYFCGKDWRAIDRSTIYGRYADLSFFSPQGLRYLLPAFLLAALEDPDGSRTCGTSISETLLFRFSHGYGRACIALLSPDQRRAIGDVLRLHHEPWQYGPLAEPDPDLALALDQLDPTQASPRRPHKRRRRQPHRT